MARSPSIPPRVTATPNQTVTATLTDLDKGTNGTPDGTVTGTVTWSWSGGGGEATPSTTNVSTYALETEGADAGKTLTVTATYFDGVGATTDTVTNKVSVSVVPPTDNNAPMIVRSCNCEGARNQYGHLR